MYNNYNGEITLIKFNIKKKKEILLGQVARQFPYVKVKTKNTTGNPHLKLPMGS